MKIQIKKRMNAVFKAFKLRPPFTRIRVKENYANLPAYKSAHGHVAIVGGHECGFENTGKIRPESYLPKFQRKLYELGFSCYFYQCSENLLRNLRVHKNYKLVVILIYGEGKELSMIPSLSIIQKIEENHKNCIIINHPNVGLILRNKIKTNNELSKVGVPVPKIVRKNTAYDKVFSNTVTGSHKKTFIVDKGQSLESDRYNAKFIDTRYSINGRAYYTCLRV